MKSFNQVTLMGNLTRDPQLRQTPNGMDVVTIGLALNRSYRVGDEWKEETTFVDVIAWGPLALRSSEKLVKGVPALVKGRLQSRTYEKEGLTVNKLEVIAEDIVFID